LPGVDAEQVEQPELEGVGWGMTGGSWPAPGMIFMVARVPRMSLPVGTAGHTMG
jgi:hypothetical protein